MFPELLYFLQIQIRTIIYATYPLRYPPCATIDTSVSDCKGLETLLEAIFWKPFQLFRRILNYVSSILKAQSHEC
jgi:hypothetical protein